MILDRLGAGGMGVVYEAQDCATGDSVALKLLPQFSPGALYRFKHEFRALADVDHPNLVKLHELVSEDEAWFFTMELVHGIDFLRWVRATDITSVERFARIRRGLAQLARGVKAIHELGKVHRDIKPSNILVTADERVVLIDYGLIGDRPTGDDDSDAGVVGTAAFMSPEQATGTRVGPAADWYSVGVVLYEVLTGKSPFSGSPVKIMMDKQRVEPRPPRSDSPEIPDDLNELCVDLLRKSPAARPGAGEILERVKPAEWASSPTGGDASSTKAEAPAFVGRAVELARLDTAFQAVLDGMPRAVIVRGESGFGKTALVLEFIARLRRVHGTAIVLPGRCYERESVPYKAFDGVIDALSEYLRRLDQDQAGPLLPADALLLARLFPVLGRAPALRRLPRASEEVKSMHQRRARGFAALRELLSRLGASRPLVVFVDDFQWSDGDSLALLAEVMHPPDAPRLLFVATVRTSEGKLPETVREQIERIGEVDEIEIGRLAPRDAERLVTLLLPPTWPDPSAAESIARDAGGHPMFIAELVRASAGGRSTGAKPLDEALLARIERLEPRSRRLLEVVAVAEVPLGLRVVAMAAGLASNECARRALQLRHAHLLRAEPDDDRVIEPFHNRVRETLLANIPASERVLHHRELAEALQSSGAATRDPHLLIRHLLAAGDDTGAGQQAEQAAERAAETLAFDRAAELYRLALRHGEHDDSRRRELHLKLAEALGHAGRGLESADVFLTVAESAESRTRLECQRRAAEQLLVTGHIERGMKTLRSVLADLGSSMPKTPRRALASLLWNRARLRARGLRWKRRDESEIPARELSRLDIYQAVASSMSLVDNIRGADFQSRYILLALATGERSRVASAVALEAMQQGSQGHLRRASKLVEQANKIADDGPELGELRAWALAAGGMVSHFAGRYRTAVELLSKAEALYRDHTVGGTFEIGVMRQFRLLDLRMMGRCRELRRVFNEALRDARSRGDRYSETTLTRAVNVVWLVDDDPARARTELASATWLPPKNSYHIQHWYKLRARSELLFYRRDIDSARAQLTTSIERLRRSMLPRVQIIRAEFHWLLGRLAVAEAGVGIAPAARRRDALKLAAKLAREGLGYADAWALLLRAIVAGQRGSPDKAADLLEEAATICRRRDLGLYAAAASRRRGCLLGGDSGRALVTSADEWMAAEGVASPERMTAMLVPGLEDQG